jgi:hypothetical protein
MTVQQIMTALTSFVDLALSNPDTAFWTSIALSAVVVLSDFKSGISIELPGRRRLSLSAIIVAAGSSVYFFGKGGFSAFTSEVAGGLFGAIIIGAVLAFIMRRRDN